MTDVGGAQPRALDAAGVGAGFATPDARRGLTAALEAEQDRWFLWLPVLFGAGIAAYFLLPVEPGTASAALPAVAILILRRALPRMGLVGLLTAALLAVACGIAVAKLRTEIVRGPVLQRQIGPVDLTGFVELVEPRAAGGQRITIRVRAIEKLEPKAWPIRVRVRTLAENRSVKPGDGVRVHATLSPPPGPALPGDYDFARSAWYMGLGGVGYAMQAAEPAANLGAPPRSPRFFAVMERVRQAIGRRIEAALPGQSGAIANALITGERGAITEATNQAFRDSGLFHILSISGLHMVIMAGAVFYSLRLMLAAVPALALLYPIKKWSAAGAMAGALGYLLISGASAATVRSYIMISIMFLAVILDRPAVALRNVALAALAILVVWPESLFDPGFQMSFAAVVALVSVYEWLRGRGDETEGRRGSLAHVLLFFGGIVGSTLIASFAVAPFGIYHFHNTQQFAILANLIAIPICNVVVMPAALATLVAMPLGWEAAPLYVMGLGIEAMVWCATTVASLPGAVGRIPAIPTYSFALMVAGGLWWALWVTRWRWLGLPIILLGAVLSPMIERPDVLIGRGAELVAVRGGDGRLSALAGRGSAFELARWLEHDADSRSAQEATKAHAFTCDAQGCVARVRGVTLAAPRAGAALRDDCRLAGILVLRTPRPKGCAPEGALVIDRDAIAARGAHALYFGDKGVRLETVAQARGVRPWATPTASRTEADAADEDRIPRGSRRFNGNGTPGEPQNLRMRPTSRP